MCLLAIYLYVYLLLEKCLFYPFVHFKIVLSSKHWTDKQSKNILAPSLLSKYIFKYFYSVCIFFYFFNLLCVQVCACRLMHGCAHSCVDQRTTFRSWFSFTMWAPGLNSDSQAHRKPFLPRVLSPCLFWLCWWSPLKYECFQFLTCCLWLWCY